MTKHQKMVGRIAAALAGCIVASASHAGTFSDTLPQFSGSGANTVQTVGVFTFDLAGQAVTSSRIDGTFGNSLVSSTSVHSVFADGILVASCSDKTAFCWTTGPEAWSYEFTGAELDIFADGQVVLTTEQTDCCTVRLGTTTLSGVTSPVPEPETFGMLIAGLGILAALKRRRG